MIDNLQVLISNLKEYVIDRADVVWGVGEAEVMELVSIGTEDCLNVIETKYSDVVTSDKEDVALASTLNSLFYTLCGPYSDFREDEYLNYYAHLECAKGGMFSDEDTCSVWDFLNEHGLLD